MTSWSPRCTDLLRQTPVHPYPPEEHAPSEETAQNPALVVRRECLAELYELTGRRGLPALGQLVFGPEAERRAGMPATAVNAAGQPLALLAWDPARGAIFVQPTGAVSFLERGRLAESWRVFVERTVLHQLHAGWLPSVRVGDFLPMSRLGEPARPKAAAAFVEQLGADLDSWASDAFERVSVGPGVLAWRGGLPCTFVAPSTVEALERVLDACSALRMPASLVLSAVPAGEPPVPAAAFRQVYHRESEIGSLRIETAGEDAIRQTVTIFDEPLDLEIVTPAASHRQCADCPVDASPRLAAFLARHQAVRTERRWPADRWAERAAAASIPPWPVLATLEEQVGGIVAPHGQDPLGRPRLMLGLALTSAAPPSLLADWTSPEEDDEPDGSRDPPKLTKWPLWVWHDIPLVFIGEESHAHFLLCDEHGRIWRFHEEFGQMHLAAGTARTFLELAALDEELWTSLSEWAPVTVLADVGGALSRELGLFPLPEASDPVVQCFAGGGLWLRQYAAAGPRAPALRIQCDDVNRMVEVTRRALVLGAGAPVEVQASRPGGFARQQALRHAGLLPGR